MGPTKRAPPLQDIEQLRMGRVSSTHVLFGGSIVYICALEKLENVHMAVPRILPRLLDALEKHGALTTPLVFCSAASKKNVAQLRYGLEIGRFEALDAEPNSLLHQPEVVASLLKRWFASMSEPLFPDHLFPVFLESSTSKESILKGIAMLPALNFATLDALMVFLARVATEKSKTQTGPEELAREFYPVLMRCPSPNVMMAEPAQHRRCYQFITFVIKTWISYARKKTKGQSLDGNSRVESNSEAKTKICKDVGDAADLAVVIQPGPVDLTASARPQGQLDEALVAAVQDDGFLPTDGLCTDEGLGKEVS